MSYAQPEITETTIKCEECQKYFKKLTSRHLYTHNLSIAEYKSKYGLNKRQPLEAFYIKQIRHTHALQNNAKKNLVAATKGNMSLIPYSKHKSSQELLRLRQYNATQYRKVDVHCSICCKKIIVKRSLLNYRKRFFCSRGHYYQYRRKSSKQEGEKC